MPEPLPKEQSDEGLQRTGRVKILEGLFISFTCCEIPVMSWGKGEFQGCSFGDPDPTISFTTH